MNQEYIALYRFFKMKNVTDKNYIEYLLALKIETILESLEYFIKNNQIKKKSVAKFYAITIKLYFYYLYDNGIENENLKKLFAYTNSLSYDNQIQSDCKVLIKSVKRNLLGSDFESIDRKIWGISVGGSVSKSIAIAKSTDMATACVTGYNQGIYSDVTNTGDEQTVCHYS